MARKLDKKDRMILSELDLDARQSISRIAKKVRLSKNLVNYRIKRLESKGVITGYKTVFDYSKLGYLVFRVYVDFYEFDEQKECLFKSYLKKDKSAVKVIDMIGKWDVSVSYFMKSPSEFRTAWFDVMQKFRDIIKNYEINLVTEYNIYSRDYFTAVSQKNMSLCFSVGNSKQIDVDEVDLKIIKILQKNARVPVRIIAMETKLGSMGVIYRIRQLEKKKLILGYKVMLDYEILGIERYKVVLELQELDACKYLESFCQNHPNITSVVSSIHNNIDFEFNLEVADFSVLSEIISTLKQNLVGKIRDYKYFKYQKDNKREFLPL